MFYNFVTLSWYNFAVVMGNIDLGVVDRKFYRVYGGAMLWGRVKVLGGSGWMLLGWMCDRMGYSSNLVEVGLVEKLRVERVLGLSGRNVERFLGMMVDLGLIKRVGRGKYMVSPVYFAKGSIGCRDRLIGIYTGIGDSGDG